LALCSKPASVLNQMVVSSLRMAERDLEGAGSIRINGGSIRTGGGSFGTSGGALGPVEGKSEVSERGLENDMIQMVQRSSWETKHISERPFYLFDWKK